MNERIRELSEQALEIVSNKRLLKDGQLERTWNPDDYDQVFAKLLVGECVDICRSDDWEDQQGWGKLYAHKIQKHFGVER